MELSILITITDCEMYAHQEHKCQNKIDTMFHVKTKNKLFFSLHKHVLVFQNKLKYQLLNNLKILGYRIFKDSFEN